MGILTTKDSARSFSTFVALFGLALLITSAMYLKKLNNWAEGHACVTTVTEDVKCNADILCSNLKYWRAAAIIGIVIGFVDILVVPFLCCCGVCIVCGCTALLCCCLKYQTSGSSNSQVPMKPINDTDESATSRTPMQPTTNDNGQTASATNQTSNGNDESASAANNDTEETDDKLGFDIDKLPESAATILNVVGWVVWVFLPFIGTLFITISLHKTDAIRTQDEQLYGSALTLFVCALLNLMVFYQKFIDSVWEVLCGKMCGSKEKGNGEKRKSVGSEV